MDVQARRDTVRCQMCRQLRWLVKLKLNGIARCGEAIGLHLSGVESGLNCWEEPAVEDVVLKLQVAE